MSTAIPFNALGGGNGFPRCVSRVSASDADFPASGLLNGNLTFEQVMHLYWNIENISITVNRNDLYPDGDSFSSTINQAPFRLNHKPSGTISKPFERVCDKTGIIASGNSASSSDTFVVATSRINFDPGGYLNGKNLFYDKDNEAYQIGFGIVDNAGPQDELILNGFVGGFGGRGAAFISDLLTVPYEFPNPHSETVYKSTTLSMPGEFNDITFYYSTRDGAWENGDESGFATTTVSISANFYTY
tara:strand:+ start:36 stop:770 length:735 start_codon:yes stop_codon:yes gene_type:complete